MKSKNRPKFVQRLAVISICSFFGLAPCVLARNFDSDEPGSVKPATAAGALEPVLDDTDLPDEALPVVPAEVPRSQKSNFLKGAIRKSGKRSASVKLNAVSDTAANQGSTTLESGLTAAESEEVSIEWDQWRNKVSKAIWARFCQNLQGGDVIKFGNYFYKYGNNTPNKFPDNTRASYAVTIDSDANLVEAKITKSSGIAKFDDLVRVSAQSVKGKKFLKFPVGSKRKQITLSLQLFTTKHGGFKDINFNDVERITASAHDNAR